MEMGGEGGAVLMCALLRLRLAVVLFFFVSPPPTSLRSGGLEHLHQEGEGGARVGRETGQTRPAERARCHHRPSFRNPPISNNNPASSSCGSPAVPRGEGLPSTRGGQ